MHSAMQRIDSSRLTMACALTGCTGRPTQHACPHGRQQSCIGSLSYAAKISLQRRPPGKGRMHHRRLAAATHAVQKIFHATSTPSFQDEAGAGSLALCEGCGCEHARGGPQLKTIRSVALTCPKPSAAGLMSAIRWCTCMCETIFTPCGHALASLSRTSIAPETFHEA